MDRRDFLKKTALGVAAVAATSLLEHPAVAKANELINPKTNNNMKKIMIIDGGPRKNMNTAAMVAAFAEGAREAGAEVKVVRLYELEYTGCVSCLACKLKNSKYLDVCAVRDGLEPVLREAAYADGLVFASPMYFFQITAQLRAFLERLVFPWLSYNDYSSNPPKGHIPSCFIYTMNAPKEMVHVQQRNMEENEAIIANALGKPERIEIYNTLQVKDYSRYEMGGFNLEAKQRWHEEHWQQDLDRCRDAGKRMAEKVIE